MMEETQDGLRAAAREMLASGQVGLFLGHEPGTLPLRRRPLFASAPEDAGRLVWDPGCADNLAVYLPALLDGDPGLKVGIAAKSCDIRSVLGLVRERQVARERVVIVGLPCPGMADRARVAASLPVGAGAAAAELLAEDRLLQDTCRECPHPEPEGADLVIGGPSRPKGEGGCAAVEAFEALPAEERWARFEAEVSKCIRCYACRQACPNCYCKTCFVEQGKPAWIGRGNHLSDRMLFHIGRIFHQAGRCVGCNACARACPMGVDLQLFTRKLAVDVERMFGYAPGLLTEEPAALCTFRQDDRQEFITEP